MASMDKERKFKMLYDEWVQPLFRFIYFKCKDSDLAQDIVQDAFVKFWDKMDTVEDGKAKSYLYTVAKNLLLNKFQHDKVVQKYEQSQPRNSVSTSPHYELEVSEFRTQLENAIQALPEKQREVFVMHRIDGYKYKEIAELLDIGQKAVEKRMSQALVKLRELCEKI